LEMPGRSVASPIIVDQIIVSTSSSGVDERTIWVTAVSLNSGEKLWEHSFMATGRPYCHPTSANAAPSLASDGERVFAFFSSNDLVCLSVSGELLWYRGLAFDYPKAGNDTGMASSPVVADGVVVVQVENQGDSFVLGIDATTGENHWRNSAPRKANWASPTVIRRGDGREEFVVQNGEQLQGLVPRTGKAAWSLAENCKTVPSSTPTGKWLLVPAGELIGFDISSSAPVPTVGWRSSKLTPQSSSVVTFGERLYGIKGSVLVAGNIADGEVVWQQRLNGLGTIWATPLVAGNRLFIIDQTGKGKVIEDEGDSGKEIAEFDLEQPVLASPAAAHGFSVVRGVKSLFAFH
jgi:outer membrane protein assembly factor BamB